MTSYTGVILDEISKSKLIYRFGSLPPEWHLLCHHMTINLGKAKHPELLGKEVTLKVISVASDDKVIAVGVDTDLPSKNTIKHITVAVNPSNGGKAKHSNDLREWKPIIPFTISGTVKEVEFESN